MRTKVELKIIADHLRSSCFLIADGAMPSNEGRGYVLRRIMRRGMRQLHKLGAKEASMYKLVDALIKEMGDAYPELARAREVIISTLKNEEEKFRETLEKGLKILEEEISKITRQKFSGAIAFKLYDTYGFPLDLTQDILKEKNIEVDVEEFDCEMELQRVRARKNWAGSGEEKEDKLFFELKEKFGETKFLGYETLSAKAKILFISTAPNAFLILDQTPFYATSGGQKGDDGKIFLGKNFIQISEAKKAAGNLFIHLIADAPAQLQGINNLKIGDEVTAEVNPQTRFARAANHSATHLMHKALKEVLSNSISQTISQRGSNVDAEYFTFDFNFNRAMAAEEIQKVENLVNGWIAQKSAVNTNLMALDKARETGAEALFGEKYDAEVRVVKMGSSVELCGGTHVKNTAEIEAFKIISEKSVASGIRRIEAKSGFGLKKYLDEQEEKIKNFALELYVKINDRNAQIENLSGVKPDNSPADESDPKILEDILKQKDKEIERLKKQNLFADLKNLRSEKIGETNLLTHIFNDVDAKELREITVEIKARAEFSTSHILAFFSCKDGKVSVCIAATNDLLEKFDSSKLISPIVETLGGKGGGGKKDFAMGGGINKEAIPHAIEVLKNSINN